MTAQSAAGQSITEHSPRDGFDALLIIGHGTRDPEGLAEFRYLVDQVARQRTDWHVTGCCLELAEPSIAVAVDRLAVSGRSRIRAMPLVLFSAGHAKRDIPDALAQAIARNPGVEIELCPPLGCNPAIVELSTERCQQAIFGHSAISPDETLLILVGRGSSDAEALAQMRQLADLRRGGAPSDRLAGQSNRVLEPSGVPDTTKDPHATAEDAPMGFPHIEVGFAAVAAPSLGAVLERAARSAYRRVIVQPHLLFAGSVLSEIRGLVEQQERVETAGGISGREWIVTEALGPDRRLVTAVVDIVSAVTPRSHGL